MLTWFAKKLNLKPESNHFVMVSNQGAVGQANDALIPFLTNAIGLTKQKTQRLDDLNLDSWNL